MDSNERDFTKEPSFKDRFLAKVKKEIVLVISILAALVALLIARPEESIGRFIDWRTLAILFCLMLVVGALRNMGVLESLAKALINRTKTLRGLILVLLIVTFLLSMFITNDVALITFVPFSIAVLTIVGKGELMILLVVLQTIAANLGSMLTPIGNPQNLFLYGLAGMKAGEFVLLMLPYTLVSLGIIIACVMGVKNSRTASMVSINTATEDGIKDEERASSKWFLRKPKFYVLVILFLMAVLTVAHLIPLWITFVVICLCVLIMDFKAFKKVDYSLLATFIFLFIFVGCMKEIDAFAGFLGNLVEGNEMLTGLASSQIISNVPAAILLSGFTTAYKPLIVGVNIGGLGTLIASMASLISFKYYAKVKGAKIGKYLGIFSLFNLLFLIVLWCLYMLINS
ncbi:MAG: citrate transporter [Lachnospiraceae bacterium]|nr:citrate transporter [Lachnospiraceae bacterium]